MSENTEFNDFEKFFYENDLEKIINFLKFHKIIPNRGPFCLKDEKQYEWRARKGTSDGFTRCDAPYSIRNDSILEGIKIPIIKIVKLIHAFAFEHKIDDVCINLAISRPTVIKIFKRLREIICLEADISNIKLGGLGEIVEIDESKFAKVKHGVGKDLKRKFVSNKNSI